MPKLTQYVSQEASRGRVLNSSRVSPQGVDVSGLARGVTDVANTYTALAQAQEREAEKLKLDEARIGVERTMSEGAALWTERMANAQTKAPKDAAGFTDGLLRDFDAWSIEQSGANQDPNGKKLLESNLTKMRQHIHAEAFKFEITQRKTALVDNYSQGVNDELSAVLVDPSQWAGAVARKRGLAQSLDLAPGIREKLERDAVERLSAAAGEGILKQPGGAQAILDLTGASSPKGRKGREGATTPDAAERVASNPILSSMTPQALQGLIDKASGLVAQQQAAQDAAMLRAAAEQDRRLKHAEAEFKVFQAMTDKGTALAPGYIESALQATAGTPYQTGIRALAQQAQETGGLARQSIADQRAALIAIDAQIAREGRSPALDKRREATEKVVKGTEADFKAEPLTAGLQRGWITALQPIQFGGGIDGLLPQVQQRTQLAAAVGHRAGVPVSPFTSDETRDLFSRIASQPAAQRSQTLAALSQSMPPDQAQALAAQLDSQSKSDQNRGFAAALQAGADRTTAGRYTSEIILKGMQALQDKTIKEERQAVEGWRPKIAAFLADKETGAAFRNPQDAAFIADKARLILAGRISEGGSSGSSSDIREAVVLAAGGEIYDHNRQKIVLPPGMDGDKFQAAMRSVKPEALGLPDGNVYINTGNGYQTMPAADFLKALPAAKLTYIRPGQYAVQAGGTYAAKANGDPVVIEVK